MLAVRSLLGMPLLLKKFLAMITRKFTGDEVWALMLETLHLKSPAEERALVVSRDEYKAKWHQAWESEGFDFLLTVPHALPAIPTGTSEKVTLVSASYMMIFNIVSFIHYCVIIMGSMANSWTMLPASSQYLLLTAKRTLYRRIS
jgi:hypothetical protein